MIVSGYNNNYYCLLLFWKKVLSLLRTLNPESQLCVVLTNLEAGRADSCHDNEKCPQHSVRGKCGVTVDDDDDSCHSYN